MIKRFYEIHNLRFSLSTNCQSARVFLDRLFSCLYSQNAECSTEWHLHRSSRQFVFPRFYIYENGHRIFQAETLNAAVNHLEWTITKKILHSHNHLLQLHAAGMIKDERYFLIVGPSGAGKSSLSLSLLPRGWKCLSDEIVFIDPSSFRLLSFPRNFHVHRDTLTIFPELNNGNDRTSLRDDAGKVRLNPAHITCDCASIDAMPFCLVFPDHGPNYRTELTPLGETQSLSLLYASVINLGDFGMKGLGLLKKFIGQCNSYRLTSSNLSSASSILSDLVVDRKKDRRRYYRHTEHKQYASANTADVMVTS